MNIKQELDDIWNSCISEAKQGALGCDFDMSAELRYRKNALKLVQQKFPSPRFTVKLTGGKGVTIDWDKETKLWLCQQKVTS